MVRNRLNSMRFVSIFFILVFYCVSAQAQNRPWYSRKKIEDFEMSVFFKKHSMVIQPYYDFHLKHYASYLKIHKDHKLVLVHKSKYGLSSLRAVKVRNRLARKFNVALNRVVFHVGTPPKHMVSSGENVVMFLRHKKTFAKKIVKRPIRRPAVENKTFVKKKPEVVYISRVPKVKNNPVDVNIGLRSYDFSNSNEDIQALSVSALAGRRAGRALTLNLEAGTAISDSTLVFGREYKFAVGLKSEFDFFSLNTKVYGRQDWSWVGSDSKFITVKDLGLHQGLELKLVRRPSYQVTTGIWGEFSFSNTISSLASTHVMSFKSEINLEWFEYNSVIRFFRLSRRYEKFDATVLGLNIGYKF